VAVLRRSLTDMRGAEGNEPREVASAFHTCLRTGRDQTSA
jgi:hypothetical protein